MSLPFPPRQVRCSDKNAADPAEVDFQVPVYHLASMARCGETLMLRTLGAHSRIRVVHNIEEQETPEAVTLFDSLRNHAGGTIAGSAGEVRQFGIRPDEVLLLKQGAYEHKLPFQGFILVRNPLSVYASLKTYDRASGHFSRLRDRIFAIRSRRRPSANRSRMSRWMSDVDADLGKRVRSLCDLEMFCTLYNRKMLRLFETGLPVVHYERFVEDPEKTLQRLLPLLGLEFESSLLHAEERFRDGTVGHGKNDLTRPIDKNSLRKYGLLTRRETDRIVALTYPTWTAYGYEIGPQEIRVERDLLYQRPPSLQEQILGQRLPAE